MKSVQSFSRMLGLRVIKKHPGLGLKRIVAPVSYWRNFEFEFVLKNGHPFRSVKVLDIGSPKLLGLYLAWSFSSSEVYSTDIMDYFIGTYKVFAEVLGIDYCLEVQDARNLGYADDYFDIVYSVSVIEHIPEMGDGAAMREICRVLKPGGKAIITVPYAERYFETFVDTDVYERKQAGGQKLFFERHYDEETLLSRLISPSKLRPGRVEYVGERVPFEKVWSKCPLWIRVAFLWLEPLIAKGNLYSLPERRKTRARACCLVLSKND